MAVTFRFVGEDQYQVEDGFSLSMMDVLFPGFLISRFMEVRFHCTRIFNRDFTEAKLKNKNKMDIISNIRIGFFISVCPFHMLLEEKNCFQYRLHP